MSKKKLFILVAAVLLSLCFLLSACSKNENANMSDGSTSKEPTYNSEEGNLMPAAENAVERLIVYEYSCVIITDDLTAATKNSENKFNAYAGYIESSESNKEIRNINDKAQINAQYVFKVKAEYYETFIKDLSGVGEVTEEKRSTYDVTEKYFDLSAYKAAKEEEATRILALYERAVSLSEINYLGSELSKVQAELNRINSDLSGFDSKLDYCTLRVNFIQYTDKSSGSEYWQKIGDNFVGAGKSFLIFLQYLLIIAVFVLPVALAVYFIIRFALRKERRRAALKAATPAAPNAHAAFKAFNAPPAHAAPATSQSATSQPATTQTTSTQAVQAAQTVTQSAQSDIVIDEHSLKNRTEQ